MSSSSCSNDESETASVEGVEGGTTGSSSTVCLRVAVGSVNPAKVRAVERALKRAVQEEAAVNIVLKIQGFAVSSGVTDQPMGDVETKLGAQNRARAAYDAYRATNERLEPHVAVGLEGGLEWSDEHETTLYCMAWMALYGKREVVSVNAFACAEARNCVDDKNPIFGLSKTAMFPLPGSIAALVQQGMELGDADDQFFRRVQSKHGSGTVGILTGSLIDRSAYYEHAILLALTPWIRPDIYPEGNS